MKYVFYLQNGIAADTFPEGYKDFYVAERLESSSAHSRYFFPGDSIQYDLDDLCVRLYDVFQDAIFPSRDDFYKNYGIQAQWLSRAGLDSNFNMPKDELITCFSTPLHEKWLLSASRKKDVCRNIKKLMQKSLNMHCSFHFHDCVNAQKPLISRGSGHC